MRLDGEDRSEFERARRVERRTVEVLDVAGSLTDGGFEPARRVDRPEELVTQHLDTAVLQVEADSVADLAEFASIDELDVVPRAVLSDLLGVLSGRFSEPPGRDQDTTLRAGIVVRRHRGVELLDDWTTHRPRVLTLHDDPSSLAVHYLLHQDVTPFVTRPHRLPDVLVAQLPEDVLHQILELEARELVQQRHRLLRGAGVTK